MSNPPKGQRPIDLLMAANKELIIEHIFEIPVKGKEPFKCKLTAADFYRISNDEDNVYELAYNECQNDGLEDLKINRGRWNLFVKTASELRRASLIARNEKKEKEEKLPKAEIEAQVNEFRANLEADEPFDLADQKAREQTKERSLRFIVPKFIRNLDNSLMFPSKEEREMFLTLITVNVNIMGIVLNAYIELANKIKEVNDKVKN